jgi:hypothetical protein
MNLSRGASSLLPRRGPLWCRIGRRLAAGHRPQHVTRAERLAPDVLDRLLAEPDFKALAAACQKLDALPLDERLERLEKMALLVIENALLAGNWRVAVFVLGERRAGRNPARRIAEGIVAAGRRAAKPPSEPRPPAAPAATPRSRPPADPAARVEARTRAGLRVAVAAELALEERAAADDVTGGAGPDAAATAEPAPSRQPASAISAVVPRLPPTHEPASASCPGAISSAEPRPLRRGLPRQPGAP